MSAMMTVIMIVPAVILLLLLLLLRTVVGGWKYRGYQKLPVADPDVAVEDGGEDEEESARDTRLVIPAPYEATYTIASPAAAATMAAAVQRDAAVTSTPISSSRDQVSGYHSGESLPSCKCELYQEMITNFQEIHMKEMKLEKELRELEVNEIAKDFKDSVDQLEDVMIYQSNVIDWQEKEIERLTR